MYPFLRAIGTFLSARAAPQAALDDTDVFSMRVWPIDIDMFLELNNGRTLTLYDLGRFRLAWRIGMFDVMRRNKWGFAVAGSFVRYRRRLTTFQRFEMRTRVVGRDGRFILMEQAMWRKGTCHSHMLIRVAVTDKDGAVDPGEVLEAMGHDRDYFPDVPAWVQDMLRSEGDRVWPPAF